MKCKIWTLTSSIVNPLYNESKCVCVCACVRVRVCVCACMRACVRQLWGLWAAGMTAKYGSLMLVVSESNQTSFFVCAQCQIKYLYFALSTPGVKPLPSPWTSYKIMLNAIGCLVYSVLLTKLIFVAYISSCGHDSYLYSIGSNFIIYLLLDWDNEIKLNAALQFTSHQNCKTSIQVQCNVMYVCNARMHNI